MLKLNRAHHLPIPHLRHSTKVVQLSRVQSESDELIVDIEKDHSANNWTLDNIPDVDELDKFWTTVESDLKKDPDWYNFAED